MWNYWRGVLHQASRETLDAIGINVTTVLSAVGTVGVFAYLGGTQGLPSDLNDILDWVQGLAFPVVIFGLSYAYHLVRIPPRLQQAANQERDAAVQGFQQYIDASPRFIVNRVLVPEKQVVRNHELLGTPWLVQAEFRNDPTTPAETAVARGILAEITFLDRDRQTILRRIPGRWENTPAPISDFDPPAAIDIGIGECRVLDLALKDPGTGVYAFSNESYRARDPHRIWMYQPYDLGVLRNVWIIQVRLRGSRVDQTFEFELRDGDPPQIFSLD